MQAIDIGGGILRRYYSSNTDDKMKQHEALSKLLLEYGYECIYMAFPLGHAGAIYKADFTASSEHPAGPETEACTMLKLHIHAITCIHNIIKCRRHLEARGMLDACKRHKG